MPGASETKRRGNAMKLIRGIGMAWIVLLLTAKLEAQTVGPFARSPEVTKLPNGLSVITVPWESPGIVAYFTLVKVGARDEVEPGHSGFAHLFEHMMFRG